MDLGLEISILENEINQEQARPEGTNWRLVKRLVCGEYESLLQDDVVRMCLNSVTYSPEKTLESLVEESVECFLKQSDHDDAHSTELTVLVVAVSCLHLFTQNNWTGPPTTLNPLQLFSTIPTDQWERVSGDVLAALSLDGEPCYELSVYPAYLLIARTILIKCCQRSTSCQTADLWLMRCLQVHQSLLKERSPSLKATIVDLINKIKANEGLMKDNRCTNIQVQFYVEAGHLCYFYYQSGESKKHFDMACQLSDLSIELTGVMGKRTRFQVKSLAQLVLKVARPAHHLKLQSQHPAPELPKICDLTDDTVLDEIKLEGESEHLATQLSASEQALVLALCHQHKKNSESSIEILREECLAFITKVLSQPQNWCVQSMALLLRTYWESDSGRRLERTMNQLDELVKQLKTPSERPSCRTHLLYCSRWQPKWYVQKELGELMLKVGIVKSALDIFLPLELWEEVIRCYKHIGRTEAAEKVIRARLEERETPVLWCHLGEVLEDPACYEKAWELSNHHYGGAQRSLAIHYLRKGKYDKAIPCFEKSLAINALQVGVWFSYGCACMAVKVWDKAAKGFRRCVALETDNFEAWNNLASVYIKSNQKPRAFSAMQEALKCEYENWRLWENYVALATDVGEFEEAIRAYHRLIDIKQKYNDGAVVGVLVRVVTENINDSCNRPGAHLRPKLLELLGRITATVTTNAEIWRHYATLLTTPTDDVTATDRQRALQYLQKCHRCLTQSARWERDVQTCKDILKESSDIAEKYMSVAAKEENAVQAGQMLASARLMLKGTIAKIKKEHTDPATNTLLAELVAPCEQLDEQLGRITEMAAQRRETT